MTFHQPLAFLVLLPLAGLALLARKRSPAAIRFPQLVGLAPLPQTLRQRVARVLPWVQGVALLLLVTALARPQLVGTNTVATARGVDIVIALDLSTSMLAVDRGVADRTRSRLVMAREVVREFIAKRPGDRIGFVAFAARPYPVAPLTLDHVWLTTVLTRLDVGTIEDGTALGDGVLAAVNRLGTSPAGSRTVIVVTDGRSNAGITTPRTAAAAARTLGVRVHAIGIGGAQPALFPVEDPLGGISWREVSADLDEGALREIAAVTGGTFFRSADAAALRAVFHEIDRLEKRPIKEQRQRSVRELFPPVLLAALFIFLLEQTLRATWLRRMP
jgi:Ca-activated chloride channel family protein